MSIRSTLTSVLATLFLASSVTVHAGQIAVFGDNGLLSYINASTSHTGVLVSDTQLATAGFLNTYDAFVYTRNGASGSPSPTMSGAAAANVSSFVSGNIVLFNGDFSDSVGGVFSSDPDAETLFSNALDFVLQSGGGYIGELFGFAAAFQSNDRGVPALGLVAGDLTGNYVVDNGSYALTTAGLSHPVTAGVPGAKDYDNWDLMFNVSGYDASAVLMETPNGRPAILAYGGATAMPTPGTIVLLGLGLLGLYRHQRTSRVV